MDVGSQNPITIVVLLVIAVAFLWLHFTNGSGSLRLGLAGLLGSDADARCPLIRYPVAG